MSDGKWLGAVGSDALVFGKRDDETMPEVGERMTLLYEDGRREVRRVDSVDAVRGVYTLLPVEAS